MSATIQAQRTSCLTNKQKRRRGRLAWAIAWIALNSFGLATCQADPLPEWQAKVVKIRGAGGLAGLESYQTGVVISPQGHILTALSYVLETPDLSVVCDDGRRLYVDVLGTDASLEIAVLKADAEGLSAFDITAPAAVEPGVETWILSNAFGVASGAESVAAQHAVVAGITRLRARRGAFPIVYDGPVLLLDMVTSNPGAAGGAVVDRSGRLVGLVGKELRSSLTNVWLNYALPMAEMTDAIEAMMAGKRRPRAIGAERRKPAEGHSASGLGITLVPAVVPLTPPYIDAVAPGSRAAAAGLMPDDLIVLVGDELVQSCAALEEQLAYHDAGDAVELTVRRVDELVRVTLPGSLSTKGGAP